MLKSLGGSGGAAVTQADIITSSTWSARGSGSFTGELKRITDVGPTGGVLFIWNGSAWRVVVPTLIYSTAADSTGTASTSEQILGQSGAFPAALLQAGSYVQFAFGGTKSGGTDNSRPRIHLGTAGTVADATVYDEGVAWASASRSYGVQVSLKFTAVTTIAIMGQGTSTFSTNSNTNGPRTATVSDVSANALIASVSFANGGTTDTVTRQFFHVTLMP